MKRKTLGDWVLTASIGAGLFSSIALGGLLIASLVRGQVAPIRWKTHHGFMLLAALWALVVLGIRGTADSGGSLLYHAYIWTLPLLLAAYNPDRNTVKTFAWLIYALFVIDLAFNLYSFVFDQDILGRVIDTREGVVGGRNGGLFAHSFYSGSISIATLITLISRSKTTTWVLALLPVANLLLAGSWRLTIAIPLIALLAFRWQMRTRSKELLLEVGISLLIIAGVFASSGLIDAIEENRSNTLRVFAWLNSIGKIIDSPWLGVGFPNEKGIADSGVSFESMDENLIGESWYLNTAITFGVPYTVIVLLALFAAFWSKGAFEQRDLQRAVLFPFVIIDLTYGGFSGGILIYTWLWLLISAPAEPPPEPRDLRLRRRKRMGRPAGHSVLTEPASR